MSNAERPDSASERLQNVTVVEEALARTVTVRWLAPEEIPDLEVTRGR